MWIRGITFLLLAVTLACAAVRASEPQAVPLTREQAIEFARNGDFEKALPAFELLRDNDPLDTSLLYDHTVVLTWAGEDQLAVDNTSLIDVELAPSWLIRPVARSARDVGDYKLAATWYMQLLERDAEDMDARLGLAMTLADAGDFEGAWSALEEAPEEQREDVQLMLAGAYLYERERRFLEALATYQRIVEIHPGNRAALRGEALSLRSVLLPKQALALAREHPGILTDEEILNLEADVTAIQIRYGSQSYYPDSRRFEGTDIALSRVDELLARDDLDPQMRRRLQYDRIVALINRLRTAEAVAEFEELGMAEEELPVYVMSAMGRAYLTERRPEDARDILEEALEQDPEDFHIKFQLIYAYADLREADLAYETAQELLETLPPINRVPGSRVFKGNDDYLRAAIMFGLARAYFDQLADSQEHFEMMLDKAPHNTDVRHELANVYRWRGWLDRSMSEYAQVLAVEPELLSARVGNAHVNLDYSDLAVVEQELASLNEGFHDEPSVKNLSRRWDVLNRNELIVDGEFGQSSGPTFGNDQYRLDAAWYSKPLAHRYRATVFTHDSYAEFPEGEGSRERIGVGVDYRYKRWQANAAVSAAREGGSTGIRLGANYRWNDHWRFGAALETNSNSTPLRGYRVGITSDVIAVNTVYSHNESAFVSAQLSFQDYSDGNSSQALAVRGQRRLVNLPLPSIRVTAIGEIYASQSDRDDVPYFSPLGSFSWNGGLQLDWFMTRRYEFALTHTLTGMAGSHNQDGFERDITWALRYRFEADLSDRFGAHIGFSRGRNVYDGDVEYSTFYLGGLRWRF